MTPPSVSYPEFGSTTAPKTARAAMASPAPTTMMMDECPRAKKNPVPSGRRPSAISLRVVLSIAEMWSASKACRAPSVHAVSATPEAEPEALELEVVRGDGEGEDAPAPEVQGQDHQGHGAEPAPFASGQLAAVRLRLDGLGCHRCLLRAGRTGGPGGPAPDEPPFLRGLVTSAPQPGDRARPLAGA